MRADVPGGPHLTSIDPCFLEDPLVINALTSLCSRHSCRCLPLIESIEVSSFVCRRDGAGGNLGEGFRSDGAIPFWRLEKTRFYQGW